MKNNYSELLLHYFHSKKRKSEAGLLNKSSRIAAALGVTIFVTIIAMYLVTLSCAT
jgi:hypothetical protein